MASEETIEIAEGCGCEGDCGCTTVACDISARPAGAPTFTDVARYVRRTSRRPGMLYIEFEPAAADTVEAVIAAERVCCSSYGWELSREPLAVTVSATPIQLDGVEAALQAE